MYITGSRNNTSVRKNIRRFWQVISDSPKRIAKIKLVSQLLEEPELTVKESHTVRWLSYYNALQTVFRSLDSLLTYLTEMTWCHKGSKSKRAKAEGWQSAVYQYHIPHGGSNGPFTILSQFLQTDNLDIAVVEVKVEQCIDTLLEMKEMNGAYVEKFNDYLSDGMFRGT